MKRHLILILFPVVLSFNGWSQQKGLTNYFLPLANLMDSLKTDIATISLLIDKSDYTLSLIVQGQVIKVYPVVFGGNPVDDKLMQGDQCTPEGTFKMVSKYPHTYWSKFIWINYPTDESRRKHNEAKKNGTIPQHADIGGEIGIHGVPEGYDSAIDQKQNWTLGCISMKNKDVNELYPYITKNTEIVIQK